MIRFPSFLCTILLASSFSAQSAQPWYSFDIYFRNICIYPVQLVVHHYSNAESLNEVLYQHLNKNETAEVFTYLQSIDDIQYVVPDNYKLEISANGKTLSLDKARFLEVLKKSDYSEEKCGFFCRTGTFSGTIKDPSLCP
ncbi:MAG: hypothetical protein LBU76_00095 [Azoarcus sp.]|jgi:hypothetical protein|nr:hypothetical protein [Azoarcus sp.]